MSHISVSHHGLSKEDVVEVKNYLSDEIPFVYARLGDVRMFAGDLEDFEVLFKQALIQIAKLRLERT